MFGYSFGAIGRAIAFGGLAPLAAFSFFFVISKNARTEYRYNDTARKARVILVIWLVMSVYLVFRESIYLGVCLVPAGLGVLVARGMLVADGRRHRNAQSGYESLNRFR